MKLNVIEFIEYLLKGQPKEVTEKVMSAVEKDCAIHSNTAEDSVLFFTMLLNIDLEKLNWNHFFEKIESALNNPDFSDHHTSIEQLVLQSFSNMACNKSIDSQLLIDSIGPTSKAYLIEYEMVYSGKTIFK